MRKESQPTGDQQRFRGEALAVILPGAGIGAKGKGQRALVVPTCDHDAAHDCRARRGSADDPTAIKQAAHGGQYGSIRAVCLKQKPRCPQLIAAAEPDAAGACPEPAEGIDPRGLSSCFGRQDRAARSAAAVRPAQRLLPAAARDWRKSCPPGRCWRRPLTQPLRTFHRTVRQNVQKMSFLPCSVAPILPPAIKSVPFIRSALLYSSHSLLVSIDEMAGENLRPGGLILAVIVNRGIIRRRSFA